MNEITHAAPAAPAAPAASAPAAPIQVVAPQSSNMGLLLLFLLFIIVIVVAIVLVPKEEEDSDSEDSDSEEEIEWTIDGKTIDEEEIRDVFDDVDVNNDGSLHRSEVVAYNNDIDIDFVKYQYEHNHDGANPDDHGLIYDDYDHFLKSKGNFRGVSFWQKCSGSDKKKKRCGGKYWGKDDIASKHNAGNFS
jgi:hypothetical protein